ncbi:MAG: AarF/ABC1/UbiB kinase family protein [Methylacidiphilales bacterium]|nr:AarF/ABC1/UbiB kinase family protein [Candidatus Methylacidiphilales bacterium]
MQVDSIKSAVQTWEQVPRYREIFSILYKYGFADFLQLVRLRALSDLRDRHISKEYLALQNKPPAVRLRLALEELGPTFVKLGQILSSRRDIIDEKFHNELCKLQDRVPPFPGEEAKAILKKELKKSPEALFKKFHVRPLASASIAQVHLAVLHTGEQVVVKIQRPDILETIEMDLAILGEIARFLDKHVPAIAALNPTGIVRDFSKTLLRELDFCNEAANMRRFQMEFEKEESLKVPVVYGELSTPRVLTMEYLKGLSVNDPQALKDAGIDPATLSETISALIFDQVLRAGFFHADPHPGNLAIMPDGVVALYDYGIIGQLTPAFQEDIADLLMGLMDRDARTIMYAIIGMSEGSFVEDPAGMEADIEAFNEDHLNKPLKEIQIGFVLNRLLDLLMTHKLRMKAAFYLGVKALSQVEAIGLTLNPDLNFIELGRPYAEALFLKKLSLPRLRKGVEKVLIETLRLVEQLPGDLKEVYFRLRSGRLSLPLDHKINPEGFEPLRKTLDQIANRLADAVLTAAVLICSGLLVLSKVPPLIHGTPLFGILGLMLGAFMTIRLIVAMWHRDGF